MKTPHLFLVPCSLFLALSALSASAAPAPDLSALAAALEKAAEEARLFAETNTIDKADAPADGDTTTTTEGDEK